MTYKRPERDDILYSHYNPDIPGDGYGSSIYKFTATIYKILGKYKAKDDMDMVFKMHYPLCNYWRADP